MLTLRACLHLLLTPLAYTTRLVVRAQLLLVSPTLPTLRHTWHGARGTKKAVSTDDNQSVDTPLGMCAERPQHVMREGSSGVVAMQVECRAFAIQVECLSQPCVLPPLHEHPHVRERRGETRDAKETRQTRERQERHYTGAAPGRPKTRRFLAGVALVSPPLPAREMVAKVRGLPGFIKTRPKWMLPRFSSIGFTRSLSPCVHMLSLSPSIHPLGFSIHPLSWPASEHASQQSVCCSL